MFGTHLGQAYLGWESNQAWQAQPTLPMASLCAMDIKTIRRVTPEVTVEAHVILAHFDHVFKFPAEVSLTREEASKAGEPSQRTTFKFALCD